MIPLTCSWVRCMAVPEIGLAPTSPLICPPPVVVIAAPERIVKWAADPKSTGAGPAASDGRGWATKATARPILSLQALKVLSLLADVFVIFRSFVFDIQL